MRLQLLTSSGLRCHAQKLSSGAYKVSLMSFRTCFVWENRVDTTRHEQDLRTAGPTKGVIDHSRPAYGDHVRAPAVAPAAS